MVTRVGTARQEMQHIGDFDYGELCLLRTWAAAKIVDVAAHIRAL